MPFFGIFLTINVLTIFLYRRKLYRYVDNNVSIYSIQEEDLGINGFVNPCSCSFLDGLAISNNALRRFYGRF